MEIPTFREETCRRRVEFFEGLVSRADSLTPSERHQLREELQAFRDSVEPTHLIVGGAALGLGAAVLPVVGAVTGPLVGGVWGAFRAKRLSGYRDRANRMLWEMDRGEARA